MKKSKNLTPKINTFDMVVSNIKDMNCLTSGSSAKYEENLPQNVEAGQSGVDQRE